MKGKGKEDVCYVLYQTKQNEAVTAETLGRALDNPVPSAAYLFRLCHYNRDCSLLTMKKAFESRWL